MSKFIIGALALVVSLGAVAGEQEAPQQHSCKYLGGQLETSEGYLWTLKGLFADGLITDKQYKQALEVNTIIEKEYNKACK